jgi:CDP-diacylglycerol--glycerol-3-phosphate 3-phosphatidyltransferase
MIRALPNLLTIGRLVLSLLVLVFLVLAAGAFPGVKPGGGTALNLQALTFICFVVAAVTDFFDGWLARKFEVTSLLGAILDPIADKVLVAGAIVGLVAAGRHDAALPGGLILFREFSVSALRETLAPRGLRLPVTMLAKWKTTVQLVALAAMLFLLAWSWWGLPCAPGLQAKAEAASAILLWLAAVITVWTGIEYALAARNALRAAR